MTHTNKIANGNITIPAGMTAIEAIESYLGNNLMLLSDKLDLQVRQKDAAALKLLSDINEAWKLSCLLLQEEKHHDLHTPKI